MEQKIFKLENLGCANCGAKIEERIQKMPRVQRANVVFATQQLRLAADDPDSLIGEIQNICDKVEPGIRVVPFVRANTTGEVESAHHCGCADCHEHDAEQERPQRDKPAKRARKEKAPELKRTEKLLWGGGVGLGLVMAAEHYLSAYVSGWIFVAAYMTLYMLLGFAVLKRAVVNISHGQVFDENFLMALATVGAVCIGEFPEAVAVMLFYRIGEYFEDRALDASRKSIMEAVDMRPETVLLVQGGRESGESDPIVSIAAEEAKPGDVILIRPGARIPLDGICIEGESRIDTSPITGEPMPVRVSVNSTLTSGGINLSGALKMRVEKPLSESMVTRILDAVENAAASKPQIDRFITRFARVYTPIVVGAALLLAVVPPLLGWGPWSDWISRGLNFLVVSCPCALVISVPMAYFSGIGRGSRESILFKGGVSLEALYGVKAVVMDKTGTITPGKFAVQRVQTVQGVEEDDVLRLAASAEQQSTHPIAESLCAAAQERAIPLEMVRSLSETAGKGIVAVLDEGVVVCGNEALMREQGVDVASQSGGTEVHVACNGRYMGNIIVEDAPKPDAAAAIQALRKRRVEVAMLTGDSEHSALHVAGQVGISPDNVHAKLLPDEKLTWMQKLRARYGSVMFVGDGINDAPVLAGADVGAAMGSGADAAIEAADVVFMTPRLGSIVTALNIARKVQHISIENIVFALGVKALVLALSAAGLTGLWMAVFADVGVSLLCIANSLRILMDVKRQ